MSEPHSANGEEKPRLYGTAMIEAAELVGLPNPAPGRAYTVEMTCPEFTCLCPISGFPDFATIRIRYSPAEKIVELKSIKLYLNRYRDQHLFHEQAVNQILDDFVAACRPRWAEVLGDFNVRGNIKTVITAEYRAEESA